MKPVKLTGSQCANHVSGSDKYGSDRSALPIGWKFANPDHNQIAHGETTVNGKSYFKTKKGDAV